MTGLAAVLLGGAGVVDRFARRLAMVGLAAVLLGGAGPPDVSGLGWTPHLGGVVPFDAPLLDSDGRGVTLRGLAGGGPVLLDLDYYRCPALCGVARDSLLAALAGSGLGAGRDYVLVSLSIDPGEGVGDAAAARAVDAGHYPEVGGHYLVGDAGAVGAVMGAVGFHARWDGGLGQFIHPAGVVVVGEDGRVSAYLMGAGFEAAGLRAAVGRAAAGGVSAEPSAVMLLCFHYDAVTGRYSLEVMKVVRLGGVLVVVGIGVLWWRLRRRALTTP